MGDSNDSLAVASCSAALAGKVCHVVDGLQVWAFARKARNDSSFEGDVAACASMSGRHWREKDEW